MTNSSTTSPPQPPPPPPPPINNHPPLSELTLLTATTSRFSLRNSLNSGQHLNFHIYPNEPAIFNLHFETFSSRSQRVSCLLYPGPASSKAKIPPVAKCDNVGLEPGKLELMLRDQDVDVTSGLEKEKNGDWIWVIPSPPTTWELKMQLPAYDSLTSTSTSAPQARALRFRWQHMPRSTVQGARSSLLNPDWKLVSMNDGEGKGEVHAVLTTVIDGSENRGQLQFRRSYGREWEVAVVVLAGVLSERERMRRDRRGGFSQGLFMWGFS